MPDKRTVLVLGATGLVGGLCLRRLLDSEEIGRVVVLARRKVPLDHPKLEARVVDFDRPELHEALLHADELHCCLGTTIKKAGSKEAFRRVDLEMPLAWLKAAARQGTPRLCLVSALGADPRSRVFYNRVKGELEEAVSRLPFRSVAILRPSLLLGERAESRPLERLAEPALKALSFLLVGRLRKYRPVPADAVAAAMVAAARAGAAGVRVLESDEISASAG